jgi:hypothetical protein
VPPDDASSRPVPDNFERHHNLLLQFYRPLQLTRDFRTRQVPSRVNSLLGQPQPLLNGQLIDVMIDISFKIYFMAWHVCDLFYLGE